MNWDQAVAAMRRGKCVRRVSESIRRRINTEGTPIYETGTEPFCLAPATDDLGNPVSVFSGAWSRILFEPRKEHKEADDWIVVRKDD